MQVFSWTELRMCHLTISCDEVQLCISITSTFLIHSILVLTAKVQSGICFWELKSTQKFSVILDDRWFFLRNLLLLVLCLLFLSLKQQRDGMTTERNKRIIFLYMESNHASPAFRAAALTPVLERSTYHSFPSVLCSNGNTSNITVCIFTWVCYWAIMNLNPQGEYIQNSNRAY